MEEETKMEYKCTSCNSTTETPGTCCGKERKEVCTTCGQEPKEDASCGCSKT